MEPLADGEYTLFTDGSNSVKNGSYRAEYTVNTKESLLAGPLPQNCQLIKPSSGRSFRPSVGQRTKDKCLPRFPASFCYSLLPRDVIISWITLQNWLLRPQQALDHLLKSNTWGSVLLKISQWTSLKLSDAGAPSICWSLLSLTLADQRNFLLRLTRSHSQTAKYIWIHHSGVKWVHPDDSWEPCPDKWEPLKTPWRDTVLRALVLLLQKLSHWYMAEDWLDTVHGSTCPDCLCVLLPWVCFNSYFLLHFGACYRALGCVLRRLESSPQSHLLSLS